VLVSPVRYEAYGLNVQEALCCGVPAIVSACAGVAERYPATNSLDCFYVILTTFRELVERMRRWRESIDAWKRIGETADRRTAKPQLGNNGE